MQHEPIPVIRNPHINSFWHWQLEVPIRQKVKQSRVWSHCSLQLPQYWKVGEPTAEWTTPVREENVLLGRDYWYHKDHYQTWLQEWSEHLTEKAEFSAGVEISLEANCRMKVRNGPFLFCGWGRFYNRSLTAWVKADEKETSWSGFLLLGLKSPHKKNLDRCFSIPWQKGKYSLYRLYVAYSQQTLIRKLSKIKFG